MTKNEEGIDESARMIARKEEGSIFREEVSTYHFDASKEDLEQKGTESNEKVAHYFMVSPEGGQLPLHRR